MLAKIDEIELAMEFASGDMFDNEAVLSLSTGKIFYRSDEQDVGLLPPDIDDPEAYVAIPSKHDLDLGSMRATRFSDKHCLELVEEVRAIFRRSGAFRRFKQLLAKKQLLKQWYDFEEQLTRDAIVEWCANHGVELEVPDSDTTIRDANPSDRHR